MLWMRVVFVPQTKGPMVSLAFATNFKSFEDADNPAGRSLMIMKSGIIDIEEDFATGYGGQKVCETFEKEGITDLFPSLFPKK